jgi:glycosyltransferase involved in cell wall biosynthesis
LQRRCLELECPEDKAVFLTNGVDPDKFVLRAKTDCRETLGLPFDRKIGVYVGYLIDRKNQSVVIQALAEMRRQGSVLPLLVLVGDGPNRRTLQREVDKLGLADHVMFTGQRPHEEVALWMGAADWLLLSSSYEGWATVYFEAMACGRPVLTSNVSSATDAICRPEYGTVVDPCTPQAFASAMINAASRNYDPVALRAYAEDHSWTRWAEQAMALFEQVIADHHSVAGCGVRRSLLS